MATHSSILAWEITWTEEQRSLTVCSLWGHKRVELDTTCDPLEKGMDAQSSILAWRIPWTEEPGRLQSMGLPRVGHD